ncbi:MAG: phosphoesterase, partial [Spirochaetales bacterium]|nr:phosphoesterase [Spirochaetales bacterium]
RQVLDKYGVLMIIDDIQVSGGLAIFNHPNWGADFNHCPQELLQDSEGYLGIEIYNGVISRLHGSPYATNRWDLLLNSGRRMWGYANDDSHKAAGDDGLGWNVVYTKEKSCPGILDALRNGCFYPSTGVIIDDIVVDGLHIEIKTANAQRVVALREESRRFATVDGSSISVDVPPDASFVRFECWGSGESFAWTQPFFVA